MRIFDKYLLKNLSIATVFITVTLAFIVFLTQSLQFLDLVINAGNVGNTFLVLTALALPRFLEVILPLAIMAATLFLYNKMILDSELIAMRAVGHSHLALAKPAILMSLFLFFLLLINTLWIAPYSAGKMHQMRLALTSEFSSVLFREGIFNPLGKGLTVYIREKASNGELIGLMIHDTRDEDKLPSTVLAKRGMILTGDKGPQVVVFDGSRQEYDKKSGVLQRLAFDRYTIQLPESEALPQRWQQPDERSLRELLNPDLNDPSDVKNLRHFSIEIHRRITTPLLAITYTLIALSALLLGKIDRRGHAHKVVLAIFLIVLIQGLYISASNIAKKDNFGLFIMYFITLVPIGVCVFLLTERGQNLSMRLWHSKQRFA